MAKDKQLTREHKDKIVLRLERAGVFLMVVSVISLAVIPLYLVLEKPGITEWLMMALTLIRMALAYLLLPVHKSFAMEELPQTPEDTESSL